MKAIRNRWMALGIVLVALLGGAGVAPGAVDTALGVVMDVDGEADVLRRDAKDRKAVAAYVGMDLFEGDTLSSVSGGKVTVFYEKSGTVTHTLEGALVIGQSAGDKQAKSSGWVGGLKDTFAGLLGKRQDVSSSEEGAVTAGIVMARVVEKGSDAAHEDADGRDKLAGSVMDAKSGGGGGGSAAAESRLEPGPAFNAPAASPGAASNVAAPAPPALDLGSTTRSVKPRKEARPAEVVADDPAPMDSSPEMLRATERRIAQPEPKRDGTLHHIALIERAKKQHEDAEGSTTQSIGKQEAGAAAAVGAAWFATLTLDAPLAQAKVGTMTGSVPHLDQVPSGPTLLRNAAGASLQPAALKDGDAARIEVAGAWTVPVTVATAEFEGLRRKYAPLLTPAGGGELVAARGFEKAGFEVAAYVLEREKLRKLLADGRSEASLKVLALQVAARAAKFGDLATVNELKPMLGLR